jgi:diadenosine tetraphosphate (Ap4A) HIT family hydrolase
MIIRLEKHQALVELEADRRADPGLVACAMCRLVEADRTDTIVVERQHAAVVLDEYAATEGHLLVILRDHAESAAQLDWPVYASVSRLVWEAQGVLETVLHPARVYTATLGAARELPMSFPHHHVHVIPVYATDERARPAHVFSWSAGITRYEPGEAARLAQRLRKAWPESVTS